MLARSATTLLSSARMSARPVVSPAAMRLARFNSSTTKAATALKTNKAVAFGASATAAVGAWLGLGQPTFAEEAPQALNSEEFKEFNLKSITPYNHDSYHLVFELPAGSKAGTFVASAVVVKAVEGLKDDQGNEIIRPYTPVSSPDKVGEIEFLIKQYPTGNLSKHATNLKPGDKLAIKGPIPKWKLEENQFEEIGLISGGSGITPIWQVVHAIASNPKDTTKVTVIYTNKTEKDILLREKFDDLAQKKPEQFKIVYGLDQAPPNWPGFEGFLTTDIAKKLLPDPKRGDKVHVFVCGPPGQTAAVSGPKSPNFTQGELKGLLAELGYTSEQVYKF